MNIKSLTLLRTPKYEGLLPKEDWGVNVSNEDFPFEEFDRLEEIAWAGEEVRIRTQHHEYVLSVRGVEKNEVDEAKRILPKMNFDNAFQLKIG